MAGARHQNFVEASGNALVTDELFLTFSRNFSTNAEPMNNMIKNLYVCLDTDVSLFTKNRDSSRYPYLYIVISIFKYLI
ncbi:MAG: hypothetical protein AUJ74_04150 [Candidatus Omnitrophica bacterium CG1_02_44_16]|nr:MAG: hypothetical protein AUJ74_04150 [Candidatus Omnitrophica bacterium CG1_02_44_16]PIY82849.1 MAG: hypothetical protein COY78_04615 [Candidatus Omnitrophica bacterium CG_4_10_14_0_8_um_filter_44_12]PIZ85132.1 MAG: hypothetical protein COX96_00090 [Candidatus Omnitrophica bacterium CG_4_10_14_0_2_um_filter_44_9]